MARRASTGTLTPVFRTVGEPIDKIPGARRGERDLEQVRRDLEGVSLEAQVASLSEELERERASKRAGSAADAGTSHALPAWMEAEQGETKTLLGLGSAGVDYIAMVDQYPNPDEKVRVSRAVQVGGGNIANTLTACSRLGMRCRLLTKIGRDPAGSAVLAELRGDGVETSLVMASSGTSTAFTYVIVDKATSTRTCIHTPQQEELEADEVRPMHLEGIHHVHLDSRHTAAALALACLAVARGIPVSIDAEKNRPPHFEALVRLCDVVFTNERFPALFVGPGGLGEEDRRAEHADGDEHVRQEEDVVLPLFSLAGMRAGMIITSLGSRGCVLVRRTRPASPSSTSTCNAVLSSTCTPGDTDARRQLQHVAALCAHLGLLSVQTRQRHRGGDEFEVMHCPAWPLQSDELVDTTGAGDGFIGGFLFAHLHGMASAQCLQVGTLCAASKIKKPGARAGLPTLPQMLQMLQAAAK